MDDLLRASNKLEGSFPMRAKKRGLSLLSAAIMAATAILLSGMTVNAQQTSGTKNIELGACGISDKDFVYFGRYKDVYKRQNDDRRSFSARIMAGLSAITDGGEQIG